MTASEAPEITITRMKLYPTPNRSWGKQWVWLYECTGPDGRRFDNRSIVTLREVLRRAYGKVKIVEPWKR